jgi:hypothetical protein
VGSDSSQNEAESEDMAASALDSAAALLGGLSALCFATGVGAPAGAFLGGAAVGMLAVAIYGHSDAASLKAHGR